MLTELLKKYDEAKAVFAEAEKDVKALRERIQSFQDQAEGEKLKAAELADEKKAVVTEVALGRRPAKDLETVKARIEDHNRQAAEFEEMRAAVRHELPRYKQTLDEAERRLRAAWWQYWAEVEKQAVEELLTRDLDPLFRAFYAARTLNRTAGGFGVTTSEALASYLKGRIVPDMVKQAEAYQANHGRLDPEPKSNHLSEDDRFRAAKARNVNGDFKRAWGLDKPAQEEA